MIESTQSEKTALVLGGGATKAAAFHLGVTMALQKRGYAFRSSPTSVLPSTKTSIDMIVGSSAGALMGAFLASGEPPHSLMKAFRVKIEEDLPLTNDEGRLAEPLDVRDLFSINGVGFRRLLPKMFWQGSVAQGGMEMLVKRGFKLNGLFTSQGMERYLRNQLVTNEFDRLVTPLFVTASRLNEPEHYAFGPLNEAVTIHNTHFEPGVPVSKAVAASVALPPLFAPYEIFVPSKNESIYFFDGEVRDTLSTHIAVEQGASHIIASYVLKPYQTHPNVGSLHNFGIPVIINQAIYLMSQQKIENDQQEWQQKSNLYSSLLKKAHAWGLSSDQKEELSHEICQALRFKPTVRYTYITPLDDDVDLFFADHFSLNPNLLAKLVRSGFHAGLQTLES